MKAIISSGDLQLLNEGFGTIGVTISDVKGAACNLEVAVSLINNNDGSLRWIWPRNSKTASFLKFYHQGSIKSKLFAKAATLASKVGLGQIIAHGTQNLYTNENGAAILANLEEWALFTGTAGENRKLIAWYTKDRRSYFAKIPISVKAIVNTQNEFTAIERHNGNKIVTPNANKFSSVIVLSDVYNDESAASPVSIFDLPVSAVTELACSGLNLAPASVMTEWSLIKKDTSTYKRFSPILLNRLKKMVGTINENDFLSLSKSHGDFTPWNMKYNDEKIFLIDWELFSESRPAFYDVFHFIYQNAILIQRKPFSAIRAEIQAYFSKEELQQVVTENGIDIAQCERLYLISIIIYYLDVYEVQDRWHLQIDWLLQTWCEALGYWLCNDGIAAQRETVLQDIAHLLRTTKYAVLKLGNNDLATVPETSDVDMCITAAEADLLLSKLRSNYFVRGIKTTKLSFMSQSSIILADGNMIHLDCIWNLKRKNLVFLQLQQILSDSWVNEYDVRVTSAEHDVEYVWLFHMLNNAAVPQRYISLFENSDTYKNAVKTVAIKYNLRENILVTNNKAELARVHNLIASLSNNSVPKMLWHTAGYFIDKLKSMRIKKGLIVTFSGVDGAGKSTIIDIISKKIEKELRLPVVLLRHRPSILPIISAWKYGKKNAEARSVDRLPRTGNNKAALSSYIRFAYYYADYLLGQFYVYFRYVLRGYVVLYDRYYFDFINDSKRSNIIIPTPFAASLYKFLMKPNLNYFLYAPADVILARKQELDAESIEMLTGKYMNLFSKLQEQDTTHTYQSISNINLDNTLNIIFTKLKKSNLCEL